MVSVRREGGPGSGGLGLGTQMTSVFTAIETPAVGDVFRVEKKSRHRLHQDKKKSQPPVHHTASLS